MNHWPRGLDTSEIFSPASKFYEYWFRNVIFTPLSFFFCLWYKLYEKHRLCSNMCFYYSFPPLVPPTHNELQYQCYWFLIIYPHVFASFKMIDYKMCSKISVHKMKSFLIDVSSLIMKDFLPFLLDWEPCWGALGTQGCMCLCVSQQASSLSYDVRQCAFQTF